MVALFAQQSNTSFPIDEVIHGDCLEVLKTLPDNSVDAIVSDPPAGIAFMGKDWDNFSTRKSPSQKPAPKMAERIEHGGNGYLKSRGTTIERDIKARDAFIAFMTEVFTEALRCLKPGGCGLIWALPRTSHWTALALEDAGFIVKDCVSHIFGQGFPKSMDISKAIDRMAGAEREVIGTHKTKDIRRNVTEDRKLGITHDQGKFGAGAPSISMEYQETKPATPEAQQWAGYGTALKPSTEFWWLVQKPLSEKTIAANVLRWNCGALNIDACRVDTQGEHWSGNADNAHEDYSGKIYGTFGKQYAKPTHPQGRFPSHLLLSHSLFCTEDSCDRSCPVHILNEQSGIRKSGLKTSDHADNRNGLFSLPSGNACYSEETGGASRYFQTFHYFSKSSRTERNQGCEGLPTRESGAPMNSRCANCGHLKLDHEVSRCKCDVHMPLEQVSRNGVQNNHPCVKSLSLMSWLCRLITPPDGIVLDPFLGSGSTAVAAIHEGFHFIGIEAEAEYVAICEARIAHALKEVN